MKWSNRSNKVYTTVLMTVFMLVGMGCELRQAMYDKGRIKPLEENNFFADGRSNRLPVEGTIARGQLQEDEHLYRGVQGGKPATQFPFQINEAEMKRGKEQYTIFCSVCHGHVGTGNGMVVQRGYKVPPSLHEERLRIAPVGHFFSVITNGFGVMPHYRSQIDVKDRWAIIAYIRALQFSQNASLKDVPADERVKLEESNP